MSIHRQVQASHRQGRASRSPSASKSNPRLSAGRYWHLLALLGLLATHCGLFHGTSNRQSEAERRIDEGRLLARDERFAAAAEAFEDATYADPQNAEAHYLLARAQLELGRSYPALDSLQRAERLRQDHPQQRVLLGRVYLRLGRLDEAERVLTSALETWPEEPHCQFAIGVLRLRQERLEAAEMSLTRAARAAPRIPGLQEKLGRVLLRLGRVDQARGRFEKAIEQRDCDDLAHGGLATALSIMVETSRARSEFQRAIECATAEHRPPWRAGLATAHAADGRFDEALQELDATEALFPAPAFAALRHRLEQAQRGWSAVGCNAHETICSQASQRLWSAVLLLYVLGAPDAAERQLRESLSLFDGDALSHWLMAVALAELDRREDAELELERAAAWQPNAEVTAAITALRAELEGEHDDG